MSCLSSARWIAGIGLVLVGAMWGLGSIGAAVADDKVEIPLLGLPLTPANAARCFTEYREIVQGDDGKLWGTRLDGPLLLVDRSTRRVMAEQADAEGVLKPEESVFSGTLPDEMTIAGTVQEWAGTRWVMLPWPLPRERAERRLMLAHEGFHYIEPRLDLWHETPTNAQLETRDGRLWMRLEWRALRTAMGESGEKRQVVIADALCFRAYRRQLCPDAATRERALENLEGLAEYTGIRLAYEDRDDARKRTLKDFAIAEAAESLVQSFAYPSGAAYGFLLDDARPDWRRNVNGDTDLGELLGAAMEIKPPADIAATAKERAAAYDFGPLAAEEDKRHEERVRFQAACEQRYVRGPTLTLPVRQVHVQFDPRSMRAFESQGRVCEIAKISDAWGILETTGGVLIAEDWTHVVVPAPVDATETELKGDGWSLRLSEGWEIRAGKRAGDLVAIEH